MNKSFPVILSRVAGKCTLAQLLWIFWTSTYILALTLAQYEKAVCVFVRITANLAHVFVGVRCFLSSPPVQGAQ
jgi:hypothetical protein